MMCVSMLAAVTGPSIFFWLDAILFAPFPFPCPPYGEDSLDKPTGCQNMSEMHGLSYQSPIFARSG